MQIPRTNTSLVSYSKQYQGGNFDCSGTKITSLDGCPTTVTGSFNCFSNDITSLHNVHKLLHSVGGDFVLPNKIKRCVLGLLFVKVGKFKVGENPTLTNILNTYKNQPNLIIQCKRDLISAGLAECAKL